VKEKNIQGQETREMNDKYASLPHTPLHQLHHQKNIHTLKHE